MGKGLQEDRLLDSERSKYTEVWKDPNYRVRNQGLELFRAHREIFGNPRTALDIGCGNGALFQHWNTAGIDGYGVDFVGTALNPDHRNRDRFSVQCLWNLKYDRTFALGVCADVMEHIPPERVDDVLAAIARCCDTVIFEIANYQSHYGDLHLSLHDARWWLSKLNEFGQAELLPIARPGVNEYVFRMKSNRE